MSKLQYNKKPVFSEFNSYPRVGAINVGTKIFFLIILHIILALVIRNVRFLATTHAVVTFVVGVWIVLTEDDIKKVVPVVAYIVGAEVLWRMTQANVFWEFGKYATAAIFVLALLKKGQFKNMVLPLLYFLLLLPSLVLTLDRLGFTSNARELISFNMSGPLAASICMIFFLQVKITPEELRSWVWAAVFPIVSILTLAIYNTATAEVINFGTESIFITSGGYGPNQVSAVLGLGAMLLIMLAIQEDKKGRRGWTLLLALALLTQSVLTFSRGGLVNVLVAVLLALLHLIGQPKKGIRGLIVILIIALVAYYLFLPHLDAFTGGAIKTRYSSLDLTNREEIAKADIELWFDNPFLGVGPGMSELLRSYRPGVSAHTEYTRVLAEHGSAGLLSLLILILTLFISYVKAPSAETKAWVVAFSAWALVEMSHSAMRLASIPFMLGIALVVWETSHEIHKEPDLSD